MSISETQPSYFQFHDAARYDNGELDWWFNPANGNVFGLDEKGQHIKTVDVKKDMHGLAETEAFKTGQTAEISHNLNSDQADFYTVSAKDTNGNGQLDSGEATITLVGRMSDIGFAYNYLYYTNADFGFIPSAESN